MEDRLESVQLPAGCVSSFCREDQLVALCCHGTKHRWARLKWLVDISEMLRQPAGFHWDRIEAITTEKPLARASTALGILLAQDLLHAPRPEILPKTLEPNERTRTVAAGISAEILSQGRTMGLEAFHSTLPSLEGGVVAWMSYLWLRYPKWLFEHAIARIDPKDRAVVQIPERFEFLYHIVRPIRLVGKYSGRLARLAFHEPLTRKGASAPDFRIAPTAIFTALDFGTDERDGNQRTARERGSGKSGCMLSAVSIQTLHPLVTIAFANSGFRITVSFRDSTKSYYLSRFSLPGGWFEVRCRVGRKVDACDRQPAASASTLYRWSAHCGHRCVDRAQRQCARGTEPDKYNAIQLRTTKNIAKIIVPAIRVRAFSG